MIRIYNSLTRQVEDFSPIKPGEVGMYTCGPTVYDYAHIGNFRTYTTADLLVRVLQYNKLKVKYIMNLTDVGHLTGDNLGDADTGEDRMEKSAQKTGKTAWEVAEMYTKAFLKDFDRLNLTKPELFAKATDHIKEQIVFIQVLEQKGFTYITSDGVYFDTSKFPDYGKLSAMDQIQEGARVEINVEKMNPRDFALWKFSPHGRKRQMEWDSPYGLGFPGWHIECSAMSIKYLGDHFDIHAGGVDLRETHHPNEIAQAEAATGETFVNYWVHGAFILVDGKRMSKSLGNNYTVADLIREGFDPLAIRYLYLQTHYRQEMNFTLESLTAASHALKRLREITSTLRESQGRSEKYEGDFLGAVNNDLNLPKAVSIMWDMLDSKISSGEKAASLLEMDRVLGLKLDTVPKYEVSSFSKVNITHKTDIPENILQMAAEREELRRAKQFHTADKLRNQIEKLGYEILDEGKGKLKVKKKD